VRPRVLVPLLLALAAALGLVVGAVLPGAPSTPVADSSTPAPSDSADPATSDSSSAQPIPDGSSQSAVVGDVTGEGGGVSAVNLPQPEFPV
jgi:hypothetical protein